MERNEINKKLLKYENEINRLKFEIKSLKKSIDKEVKNQDNGIMDIFYPQDDIITDAARGFKEQLQDLIIEISDNQRETGYVKEEISKLDDNISALKIQLGFLIKKLNILKNCQREKSIEISKLTREKTLTENYMISLQGYVSHVQIILTKCEKNNEFLDFGINDLMILLNN
ncbi:hypothetical protein DICPUDRAFT_152468 [Dictyostelium purpureum]|uniref:Uncharacterized protein n=1 Tax=Dictyostelium purpureum TaxID=5786 RepID=F0ZLF7_DICPU|nr:uncharacterized protein DICPUDRAFT_152468 [Dictyostelium purpureum]EGC35211.1 hypothetical protein DICPUDRAFT_152468 [Dictyostelium purpureum]|eukprot:XP_003288249.1 hypothetical protein DICPUDRAFT_152468 [Dictyostelium purpureum]